MHKFLISFSCYKHQLVIIFEIKIQFEYISTTGLLNHFKIIEVK
jgi:hypothetical protein